MRYNHRAAHSHLKIAVQHRDGSWGQLQSCTLGNDSLVFVLTGPGVWKTWRSSDVVASVTVLK